MEMGLRLRALRLQHKMSQGDVERKTGLLRCYISRVENGFTVPQIDTLEKICVALEEPLYRLFYEGEAIPEKAGIPFNYTQEQQEGPEIPAYILKTLVKLPQLDRDLLLQMALTMARRSKKQNATATRPD